MNEEKLPRVIVTNPMCGLVAMQVCAVKDATDEEILIVCNIQNPSGTSNGWSKIVRNVKEGSLFETEKALPVRCSKYPERLHFLILC